MKPDRDRRAAGDAARRTDRAAHRPEDGRANTHEDGRSGLRGGASANPHNAQPVESSVFYTVSASAARAGMDDEETGAGKRSGRRQTDWERGRIGAPGLRLPGFRPSAVSGSGAASAATAARVAERRGAFQSEDGQPEDRRRADGRRAGGAAQAISASIAKAVAAREESDNRVRSDRKRAGFAMALAAFAVGVPPDDLLHPTRLNATAAFARHAAMYLCHVAFGMSLARVASAFRRDRSTVSHACHRMEDRREDNRFDAWMDAMERSARHAHVELAGDLP